MVGLLLWIVAIVGLFYIYKKHSDRYNAMTPEEKIAYEMQLKRWREWI